MKTKEVKRLARLLAKRLDKVVKVECSVTDEHFKDTLRGLHVIYATDQMSYIKLIDVISLAQYNVRSDKASNNMEVDVQMVHAKPAGALPECWENIKNEELFESK